MRTLSVPLLAVLGGAILAACGGAEPAITDPSELKVVHEQLHDNPSTMIAYGSPATEWYHEATVSLHSVRGGSVSALPFCTGTVIAPDIVMTAGHCTYGSSASQIAVYQGMEPATDPAFTSHVYLVDDINQHPSFSYWTLENDISLLHLTDDIMAAEGIDCVSHLPSSLGLSNADAGMTINIAGYGDGESFSDYGQRQQIDMTFEGMGCAGLPGCFGADSTQMFAYDQSGGGPCPGDSGGPAFVFRGSDVYVGGITSWGSSSCYGGNSYGISQVVDVHETFINDYLATYGHPSDVCMGGSSGGGGGGGADTTPPTIMGLTAYWAGPRIVVEWTTDENAYGDVCKTDRSRCTSDTTLDTYSGWYLPGFLSGRTLLVVATDAAGNESTDTIVLP